MKRKRFLISLVLIILIAQGLPLAKADSTMPSLPDQMPDQYMRYCWIGGAESKGATFVIKDVDFSENVLKIHIIQLPNDDFTALVDNQVEGDPSLENSIKAALEHGSKVLGTLCDLLSITNENGDNILKEYSISSNREGPTLSNEIRIFLPSEGAKGTVNVRLVFGVNEDLKSLFPMSNSLTLSLVLP